MLYKITNGAVSYGADTVLERIDFEIDVGQKIAVVGRNGCGKSTLLKAISGIVEIDEGCSDDKFSVSRPGNRRIGYLQQMSFDDENVTLLDEILKAYKTLTDMAEEKEKLNCLLETEHTDENIKRFTELEERFELLGGYYFKKEYEAAIKSFGFTEDDKTKPLSEFSGGQRTKIAFLRLLLEKPDILLLDEPTNHLDITAVMWLEDYLRSYKNAVVIVSHDRMFLDKIVNTVYEIEYGVATKYVGTYTDFMEQKKINYERNLRDYEAQRKEIARLMQIVERFKNKPTKVAMTRSKLKQIEHMSIIEQPDRYDMSTFHANCQPEYQSVKKALYANELTIGYTEPLATLSFEVLRGSKLGIIGPNGIGKSTLIKTIVGKIEALAGEVSFGANVSMKYFDQQMALYSSNKTLFDDVSDEFPLLTNTQVRSALGAFQFTGEDVFKTVDMLSGGERVRLALCKIFMTKPNFLILDEPTNHMDIIGKDTLERLLLEYEGTVIFVSHDRYFVNRLADSLIVFENEAASYYNLRYSEYLERIRPQVNEQPSQVKDTQVKKAVPQGMEFKLRSKEIARNKRKKEKLEAEISVTEQKLSDIENRLNDENIASDYEQLSKIADEKNELESHLLGLMEEWDALQNLEELN